MNFKNLFFKNMFLEEAYNTSSICRTIRNGSFLAPHKNHIFDAVFLDRNSVIYCSRSLQKIYIGILWRILQEKYFLNRSSKLFRNYLKPKLFNW